MSFLVRIALIRFGGRHKFAFRIIKYHRYAIHPVCMTRIYLRLFLSQTMPVWPLATGVDLLPEQFRALLHHVAGIHDEIPRITPLTTHLLRLSIAQANLLSG